ncbi:MULTISPECIES: hypothetical protein [unclassified Herbaspirillum]|uniref:hypothetical protein n=1 Tax=unclassified Herbaspirillum TaxID=2624150 RepID=UPI0009825153|nr:MULTISPECIES: hypothetical protein [unclassified Herbaspirillum]MCI1014331.1 hypothetical protein [Herbaspirillum sp. C7C2]ONN64281.1 hypothetical protein BTM36_22620 [Herbaspirillum sp. VT-16-41]
MTLPQWLKGVILGSLVSYFGHALLIDPRFHFSTIDLEKVEFVSERLDVFKTQDSKEVAFTVFKETECYRLYEITWSFGVFDPKDGTTLEEFIICPGLGTGWLRDGI